MDHSQLQWSLRDELRRLALQADQFDQNYTQQEAKITLINHQNNGVPLAKLIHRTRDLQSNEI